MLQNQFRTLGIMFCAAAVASCSMIPEELGGEARAEYKHSRSVPVLEVPPDLETSRVEDALPVPDGRGGSASSLSDYQQVTETRQTTGRAVLPQQAEVRVLRQDDRRWLVVAGDADAVWDRMREFWLEQGFLVELEDPDIGILETGWSENRADIESGPIRDLLKKVIDFAYSAATRDKFRVRLERAGTDTELFLTHYGVEEVITSSATGEDEGSIWKQRPNDPELEAEMLSRMMVFFGVSEDVARSQLATRTPVVHKARLVRGSDGLASLVVEHDFPSAWRLTGLALDRVGFTVEDRDRSRGQYFVQYKDPFKQQDKGLLSGLAFWKDEPEETGDQYVVVLEALDNASRLTVLNDRNERDNSETAVRILTLLQEQLR